MKTNLQKVYGNDNEKQIIDYLLNNGKYPFTNKKVRISIIDSNNDALLQALSEVLLNVNILVIDDFTIQYCRIL